MQTEQMVIHQADGHTTELTHYISDSVSKGSILILHGMAEHHERYDSFARYLCNQQFDVYLYDHRGHGTHLPQSELGFFGSTNGYKLVTTDAIHILEQIRLQQPDHPLFLFGHSMGSILTRNVIQAYDALDGVIICGTANPSRFMTMAGLLAVQFTGYRHQPKKKAPMIDKMMFGGKLYNQLNTRTNQDWLSKNKENVDRYIQDDYCGFICSCSFYHDLLKLTDYATQPQRIQKTRKDLPLLIISGDTDPVGGYGKDVTRLKDFYLSHSYQDVSFKLYQEGRHEILNDDCAPDVYADVSAFLSKHTASMNVVQAI